MAAPVTLTASSAEGQLLQLIEHITNIQLIAQANGLTQTPPIQRPSIVQSNVVNPITGIASITLQLPFDMNLTATGTGIVAREIY